LPYNIADLTSEVYEEVG